ncbi:hypothetical protein I7I50_11473 [Histoplasma capsulatum G186AR]|uniref:Uncharacterized protein n=1 Tax=Ajellomyces capsulatus TaxID=5037 RepID=A0A8H7Z8B0_AJECA|nr:hypothetical protein I7I52_02711 [Histoplasma capsulatum]QSS69989.1 hypothetical protein I7I50_11473 [Histoplasma capsulatum G186AR]
MHRTGSRGFSNYLGDTGLSITELSLGEITHRYFGICMQRVYYGSSFRSGLCRAMCMMRFKAVFGSVHSFSLSLLTYFWRANSHEHRTTGKSAGLIFSYSNSFPFLNSDFIQEGSKELDMQISLREYS